ncbi:MAG: hypothetical protein U0270_07690 [Labilithrix sp.]
MTLPLTTAAWGTSSADYKQAVRDMALAVAQAKLMTPVHVHTSDGATPVVVRGGSSGNAG